MSNYLNIFKEEIILGHIPTNIGFGTKDKTRELMTLLNVWRQRSNQRAALKQLDQRMLADIGITSEQAIEESKKRFWKN